uniref:Uncharacterized protein n=1 Tax=Parascaris univalens TaxID=6257 RepID=A0A915AG18_PARUN
MQLPNLNYLCEHVCTLVLESFNLESASESQHFTAMLGELCLCIDNFGVPYVYGDESTHPGCYCKTHIHIANIATRNGDAMIKRNEVMEIA